MKKEEDNIELRSDDFQDILGGVPHWLLRWGITVLALILAGILFGSMIFKYPEIISGTIILTGSTPPTAIVSRSTGKLDELYITDNQEVKQGEYLAIINNPAHTADIIFLKKYINEIDLGIDISKFVLPPKDLMLGNLQTTYSTLYLTLFEYVEYKRLMYHPSKIEILRDRIDQYEKQYQNTLRQKKIIEDQLVISQSQFKRDSTLHFKGVISRELFETSEVQHLNSHLSYENICSSLDNMKIQIAQLNESIFDIEFQFTEKENNFQSQLRTIISQLQNDIQSWELNYVLTSPINGKVTFTNFWVTNQDINTGDVVFNIIPDENVEYIGKASLPIARSGKVKIGQKVNIRFENFPDNEFGIIKGKIKNISLVPTTTSDTPCYALEIELTQGLLTSYNKELPYLPGMQGNADIITEDMTLFERFIMPIRKVLNEGFE